MAHRVAAVARAQGRSAVRTLRACTGRHANSVGEGGGVNAGSAACWGVRAPCWTRNAAPAGHRFVHTGPAAAAPSDNESDGPLDAGQDGVNLDNLTSDQLPQYLEELGLSPEQMEEVKAGKAGSILEAIVNKSWAEHWPEEGEVGEGLPSPTRLEPWEHTPDVVSEIPTKVCLGVRWCSASCAVARVCCCAAAVRDGKLTRHRLPCTPTG